MKRQKRKTADLNLEESELIEQLRRHPKIRERIRNILELANASEGPLKTADEIEELLIEEIRRLGSATMHEWAQEAAERVDREVKEQDPAVLKRKKKR